MDKTKIYPRTGDKQTVYLRSVITRPTIEVGDFTIYNDFVNDPRDFEKNKDVEPYSIVGGVPAKEIRKRFTPDIIEKLQNLQWWNWPVERIKESIHDIQSGNIEAL